MANEIKEKYGTVAAMTCTLASVTDAAGRVATAVDNTTVRAKRIQLYVRIKKGSAAGTGIVKIYRVRLDNHGTEYTSDNLGASDAAVSTEPPNADLIGSIVTTASTSISFYGDVILDAPGPEWSVCIWNASGATISSTGSDSFIHYVEVTDEVQ